MLDSNQISAAAINKSVQAESLHEPFPNAGRTTSEGGKLRNGSPPVGPSATAPEGIDTLIDRVIIPALLARFFKGRQSDRLNSAEEGV